MLMSEQLPPSTDDYAPSAPFYDYVPVYRHRGDVCVYVEEALDAIARCWKWRGSGT